jgi:pyrroloquinoline quinone biosynthesis protein B
VLLFPGRHAVIVRVLGSAAGGGSPQWNCYCRVCTEVRAGGKGAIARTQSSIALRADDGPWFLVNASPDLREQLAELPLEADGDLRATPFAGIVLTDAEIDHTAGLLLMRESSVPLHVYSTEAVRRALTDDYPVLRMLERYCGVRWTELEPGRALDLDGTLEVDAFVTGGDPPLYVESDAPDLASVGLTIRDRASGGVLTYAPALEALDDELAERFDTSDCLAVDGTFWTVDELVALGLATRDALAMGHLPLSGPGGSLERLQALRAKTILVHVNNTNPILLEGSEERGIVTGSGLEVAHDGMEIRL